MIKAKAIYSALTIYNKGVSHRHLCFGRDSKVGKGVGKVYGGKKGRLKVCLY